MQEDILERLAKVETIQAEHGKKLDSQMTKNETLIEMKTLMSMQIESNKKQDEQLEKFGNTLDKVNDNLTHLNSKQELLDERVTGIESNLNKQTFSLIDVIKYIGATGIGLLLAWLYVKLGLSK